ncbi:hypothetical protein [Amycolatopsis minnesotensis]|uniref:Uncharacterized protein n=1 Tax=Amycolatopsis minnesotensis TaxID=337894 RepID=A0ABN2R325_9PSEU
MAPEQERDLVAAGGLDARLGRRIVSELAPDEMPLFDQTWQVLGRHPRRRGRRREEPLGFGLPAAGEVVITAIASGVVLAVLKDLSKDFGSWSGRVLARLFRRKAKALPDPPPRLPEPRLREIRAIAYQKARKLGMSKEKADALADALISELAIRGQGS